MTYIYTEPNKKLILRLSAVAVLLKKLKMSNDLHLFWLTMMCPIKQIFTRMKAF